MCDHDLDFPRAYTVPGIPHKTASALGEVGAGAGQSARLGGVAVRAGQAEPSACGSGPPGCARPHSARCPRHDVQCFDPGDGMVVALWPDEKHLLEADESASTRALAAVTLSPMQTVA